MFPFNVADIPTSPASFTVSVFQPLSFRLGWALPSDTGSGLSLSSDLSGYTLDYGSSAVSGYSDTVSVDRNLLGLDLAPPSHNFTVGTNYKFRMLSRNVVGNSSATADVTARALSENHIHCMY